MDSAGLRRKFLDFFATHDHTVRPSDSLVPSGDPTVLFTSAGMNQFKPNFLGLRTDLKRAASCQKCLRTGDLDLVGKTPSHHSFFEMLGNFSFGDYFKTEAIRWGWEFLTGTLDFAGSRASPHAALCLALPGSKLWVSVYEEDEEAYRFWRKLVGVPEDRIRRFGQVENFWPASAPTNGPNGPCGPCSEIYFDPDGRVEGPRSVEVWNLVFTQFDRQPDGSLKPLPRKNIDTGMGLERLARVVQGVETDYETDLFAPIMSAILRLGHGGKARVARVGFAQRAIADHTRAAVFLISEGMRPSNESRGYVLRMLIRRAYRLARATLDVQVQPTQPGILFRLADAVLSGMVGAPYADELRTAATVVKDVLQREEAQFCEILQAGQGRLDELIAKVQRGGTATIQGDEAFLLYDTYGFPFELTLDAAEEQGLLVDRAGYERALAEQQQRSRAGSQFAGPIFVSETVPVRQHLPDLPGKDEHFVGYEALESDTIIRGLWDGRRWIDARREGQRVSIVLERSPFYGESGGQVGDIGVIEGPRGRADIVYARWWDDVLVHQAIVSAGVLKIGEPARATVDGERRLKVARSHTATHMLHWALREVLGPEAVQAGSLVDTERLRFDFTGGGLHEEQRHQVEALVNSRIRLVDGVAVQGMRLEEAKRIGALAMFGERYGERVRVVSIGDYSRELCGGTHVPHTGFVGVFAIVEESAIAAGTRRIEALVGGAATEHLHRHERLLEEAARRLGRPAEDLVKGLEGLLEQLKRSEGERKALQQEVARVQATRLRAEGKQINGITWVAARLERASRELLAALADAVRGVLGGEGAVLLAATDEQGRVSWVMSTTAEVAKRLDAGKLLKIIAAVTEGSGGGRPEFAQGGGKEPSKIPEALARAEVLVREALGA